MRYIILVLLNLPVIALAFLNMLTKYKMGRISRRHFIKQLSLWVIILFVIIGSFPIYNALIGRPIFDSIDLSVLDIVQTTVIVSLIYVFNDQRQKLEYAERRLRDFHQEISIRLSER